MYRPFLIGPRLYLRVLEEADISEDYISWLNDPEVTRYLGTGRYPSTPEMVSSYLNKFQTIQDGLKSHLYFYQQNHLLRMFV